MTKMDGDARGGAAISIRSVTGVPIKYLGTGEGIEASKRTIPTGWLRVSSEWAI
jgi:signal recognition particle subunit SRP54